MACNVFRQFAIWRNRKFIDSIIGKFLDKRLASIDQEAPLEKPHNRPLIDLAIRRYLKSTDGTPNPTRAARNAVLDQ